MSRPLPPLAALHAFEAAARHEGFQRAGEELHVSAGAIGHHVKQLEAWLGIVLFQRLPRGVVLTNAGQRYAASLGPILNQLADVSEQARRQGDDKVVTVTATSSLVSRWLMPRLGSLAGRHPDIVVHIDAYTKPFMFADTEYDGALYAGTPEQLARWPGTRATLLMHEEIVPVASPRLLAARSAWQPQDLLELTLLQQSTRPGAWRQWFDAMQVEGEGRDGAHYGARYELFSMLAMAAVQGQGAVLLPRMLDEAELARGELRIVCERPLRGQRAYYLITPETAHEKTALQQLRAWLQDEAA